MSRQRDSSAAFRPTAYWVMPNTFARLVASTRTTAPVSAFKKSVRVRCATRCQKVVRNSPDNASRDFMTTSHRFAASLNEWLKPRTRASLLADQSATSASEPLPSSSSSSQDCTIVPTRIKPWCRSACSPMRLPRGVVSASPEAVCRRCLA